jgi:transcriptional regulator with XRE-family HTH domain
MIEKLEPYEMPECEPDDQATLKRTIAGFTVQVVDRMGALNLNRKHVAVRLGTSPAYITKMLRGNTNFTLETMVKIANSLDSDLRVELVPKSGAKSWIGLIEKASLPSGVGFATWSHLRRRGQADEQSSFIGPRRVVLCDELYRW